MSTVDAVCACFDLDLLVALISNLFCQSFVQLKENIQKQNSLLYCSCYSIFIHQLK